MPNHAAPLPYVLSTSKVEAEFDIFSFIIKRLPNKSYNLSNQIELKKAGLEQQ